VKHQSLLILSSILLFSIAGYIFLFIRKIKTDPEYKQLVFGCNSYGRVPDAFYLNSYTVKPGDTLLSISENELGQSSRIDELIQLNKQNYPTLSFENPTIETGWVFKIPPKFFPKSTGYIVGTSGRITEINDKSITINMRGDQKVEEISYKVSGTRYLSRTDFNADDCVYIIKDASNRVGTGILAVSPQDQNYFKNLPSNISINFEKYSGKCNYYGRLDEDFYTNPYVAKKGDSISSIAKTELGDVSRTQEIINLNLLHYPHLSLSNPFLEVGWIVKIPSNVIPKSDGVNETVGGEVQFITNNHIFVDTGYLTEGFDSGPGFKMEPWTRYLGKNSFVSGDCVYVIEGTRGKELGILAITSQDKNYFK